MQYYIMCELHLLYEFINKMYFTSSTDNNCPADDIIVSRKM